MVRHWFLDFDDTLASGSTTWGLKYALPKLIRENGLSFDRDRFQRAALVAQERVAGSDDLRPVMDELFDAMGWPRALQKPLVEDVLNAYEPELFPDAIPFLDRLRAAGSEIYILSNNPRSVAAAQRLGIADYFTQFFTPETSAAGLSKPDPRLWESVAGAVAGMTKDSAAVVGDDPWSDGAFADGCNLTCWLVDRDRRFTNLREKTACRWVTTLTDIPVG